MTLYSPASHYYCPKKIEDTTRRRETSSNIEEEPGADLKEVMRTRNQMKEKLSIGDALFLTTSDTALLHFG